MSENSLFPDNFFHIFSIWYLKGIERNPRVFLKKSDKNTRLLTTTGNEYYSTVMIAKKFRWVKRRVEIFGLADLGSDKLVFPSLP